ncbi:MAG TPA: hypothetical protein VFI97_04700 [Arthrobacter sp.]|nr:hypothetical protein [Arthrobacter sp.]
MVVTTPTDEQGMPSEPGAINGGMFRRDGELKSPIITIDVDDIDAALEKIGSLGGSTIVPRAPVMDRAFTLTSATARAT